MQGAHAALALVDDIDLDDYHLFFCRQSRPSATPGRPADAYARAADLAPTNAERAVLFGWLNEVEPTGIERSEALLIPSCTSVAVTKLKRLSGLAPSAHGGACPDDWAIAVGGTR